MELHIESTVRYCENVGERSRKSWYHAEKLLSSHKSEKIDMPTFGARSQKNLKCMHPLLRRVANAAIEHINFTIICSVRSKADQDQAYNLKRSRAHFGQSPHNYFPSLAFDFIPYPFTDEDWDDLAKFDAIAKVLKDVATPEVAIHWGGDWATFKDTPHIELQDWRKYIGKSYNITSLVVSKYNSAVHPNPYA
jgi:peptidoglycan LD-endopeptidase CwlK